MNALAKHTPVDQLPVASAPMGNPLMEMLSEAIRAGQPIDVIREIKAMVTEIAADEARRAFDEAIAEAKAEIKPIVRTEKGHNGKYADLAAVENAVGPVISRFGLNYRHKAEQGPAGLKITCILSHKQGHREETSITAGPDTSGSKNSIQAIGSTQTYLMRYTLLMALGLSTTKDDDGVAAGGGEVIDAEQVAVLRTLLDETSSDTAKFCQVMKVDGLPSIPASKFKDAVAKLNAKKARTVQ